MFGLILATCLSVSPCDRTHLRWDIIEVTNSMEECHAVRDREPEWRQKLLMCDEITPVDENGKDLPLPTR